MNRKKITLPLTIIICVIVLGCIGIASGFDKDAGPVNTTTTNPSVAVFGQQDEQTTKTIINRQPELPVAYRNHELLQQRSNGGCETLTGTIKPIIIFVNDSTSVWTESDKANYKNKCNSAMSNIKQDAAKYGHTLTFNAEYISVTIPGSVETTEITKLKKSILSNAGLNTHDNVNDMVEQKYGVDEAPVFFCFNKNGRANASHNNDIEYVILYKDCQGFRHEMYHLFGAVDYYYPDDVKDLAKKMFADSVMLADDGKNVDELTAYTVGWTDILSAKTKDFLDRTAHVTADDINNAIANEMYTGYVVDRKMDTGVYTGYLNDGVCEGQGVLRYTNGDEYSGNWKNGMLDGQGTYSYSNGDVYTGGWKNNEFDGYGVYTYADGQKMSGYWQNGDFVG